MSDLYAQWQAVRTRYDKIRDDGMEYFSGLNKGALNASGGAAIVRAMDAWRKEMDDMASQATVLRDRMAVWMQDVERKDEGSLADDEKGF